jgi:hypothetical protein
VLHTPTAVGGHPPGLAAAERELGLDSMVVTLHEPPFGYGVDRVLAPKGTPVAVREWRRWRAVLSACREADVVHFNFGSTLAPAGYGAEARTGLARSAFAAYAHATEQLDLKVLRRLGRAVFVTFQGDDARPGGDIVGDDAKRRRIERFTRYADGLYVLNPDLLAHVPRAEFLPYASVDPHRWTPSPPAGDGPLRLVHAPSDRARKGTESLIAAVERLRSDGLDVELELVEGRTKEEARRALTRADLVVDQLLVGWYGGVAVEAMALAKPVVARLDPNALAAVPPGMREQLPVVTADQSTVELVLRELATTLRNALGDLGLKGRDYVERWHDPLEIARRVVADYERALFAHGRSA